MRTAPERVHVFAVAIAALAVFAACSKGPPPARPSIYASAEAVEENFRGKPFVLGTDNTVAEVRPPGWDKDRWLKLPFWFGINILVPGVRQPKEGEYYVVSEAQLGKPLEAPGEWMIEAGSSLIKQETVLQTGRTHYLTGGKLLPIIVQYMGKRSFTRADGKRVEIPVVREVSSPMRWTLGGGIPSSYARYRVE
jgi:hypothetical protein